MVCQTIKQVEGLLLPSHTFFVTSVKLFQVDAALCWTTLKCAAPFFSQGSDQDKLVQPKLQIIILS